MRGWHSGVLSGECYDRIPVAHSDPAERVGSYASELLGLRPPAGVADRGTLTLLTIPSLATAGAADMGPPRKAPPLRALSAPPSVLLGCAAPPAAGAQPATIPPQAPPAVGPRWGGGASACAGCWSFRSPVDAGRWRLRDCGRGGPAASGRLEMRLPGV